MDSQVVSVSWWQRWRGQGEEKYSLDNVEEGNKIELKIQDCPCKFTYFYTSVLFILNGKCKYG